MNDEQKPARRSSYSVFPPDRALIMMQQATAIAAIDTDTATDTVATDFAMLLDRLTPVSPRATPDEENRSFDLATAPFRHQKSLDMAKAASRHTNAKASAAFALKEASNSWSQALSQRDFAMFTAQAAMTAAVKTASDCYIIADKSASDSHSLYLYFAMRAAIAEAIQNYQTAAASAATTLAGEAGTLLAAYAAFYASAAAAESHLLSDQATAKQNFWQALRQVRDAV